MAPNPSRAASALQAAAKSRSYILDPPSSAPKVKPARQAPDAADSNAYLKVLASPLRLCTFTERVLPKELLINLKPVWTLISDGRPRLVLTPDRIMHPRFAESLPGKGGWVICRKAAIKQFRDKHGYKRIHPSASFPLVTSARIQYQLASRVVQESTLFAERIKSRAGNYKSGGTRACPIRRLTWEEVEDATKDGHLGSMAVEGQELVGVVIVSEVEADGTPPFSALLPADLSTSSPPFSPSFIPIFHLPTFFNTCIAPPPLLPSSTPTTSRTPPPSPPRSPAFLIESVRDSLDSLVDLFHRRAERLALGTNPPSPLVRIDRERDKGVAAYAIYAPVLGPTGSANDDDGVADSVPLALALWRCRLWVGEGWGRRLLEEEEEGDAEDAEEE